MKERIILIVLWVLAVLALATGGFMTVVSKRAIEEASSVLARKSEKDLVELRAMSAGWARYVAAQKLFEQLPHKKPAELDDILKQVLPEYDMDNSRQEDAEITPGWRICRREMVFRDVPVEKIMNFIYEAEMSGKRNESRLRPPWRAARCIIRSSSRSPGLGQVILQMEAVAGTEN